MPVSALDHFTLRVDATALAAARAFYVEVLGLTDGPRPDFVFPGHWLYAGERALVHLAGLPPAQAGRTVSTTGKLDHIALRATGLADVRSRLRAAGVPWREAPVPGFALHQLFVTDPFGLSLELTFDAAELGLAP